MKRSASLARAAPRKPERGPDLRPLLAQLIPKLRRTPTPPVRVVVSWCPKCGKLHCAALPSRKGTIKTGCCWCGKEHGHALVLISYKLDTTRGFQ
jgi:hypothetical protein